jgi:hypothetical protein
MVTSCQWRHFIQTAGTSLAPTVPGAGFGLASRLRVRCFTPSPTFGQMLASKIPAAGLYPVPKGGPERAEKDGPMARPCNRACRMSMRSCSAFIRPPLYNCPRIVPDWELNRHGVRVNRTRIGVRLFCCATLLGLRLPRILRARASRASESLCSGGEQRLPPGRPCLCCRPGNSKWWGTDHFLLENDRTPSGEFPSNKQATVETGGIHPCHSRATRK